MKDDGIDFNGYIKDVHRYTTSEIKPQYELDGVIYYPRTSNTVPRWKEYIEELAVDNIEIDDNSSNKAVMLVKVSNRVFAIVFGYGRTLLKEDKIERNFGLKVSLNVIDPSKIRSTQTVTVDDNVVSTQSQASKNTSQESFGLNVENDIMREVTGAPSDTKYGNYITGKDSLTARVCMALDELKSKLALYFAAYNLNDYKSNGFEWVDNVKEIKDDSLKHPLKLKLETAIRSKDTSNLYVAPSEIIDWENTKGFCFGGINKKTEDPTSYTVEIDLQEYLNNIRSTTSNVYEKIKRDKLYAMRINDEPYTVGSIYNCLIFQTNYNNNTYILISGNWYEIDTNFFNRVHSYVKNKIRKSSVQFPSCGVGEDEGPYSKRISDGNPNWALMDRKLVSVLGGPKQIEACDIFTNSKQFIHIKKRYQSAQLSHLFAQGRISANCFVSDLSFRTQVYEEVKAKLGNTIFDPTAETQPNEYEVVYAIIDNNNRPVCDSLPFFSLLNLMLTAQEFERMYIKCSVVKIIKK